MAKKKRFSAPILPSEAAVFACDKESKAAILKISEEYNCSPGMVYNFAAKLFVRLSEVHDTAALVNWAYGRDVDKELKDAMSHGDPGIGPETSRKSWAEQDNFEKLKTLIRGYDWHVEMADNLAQATQQHQSHVRRIIAHIKDSKLDIFDVWDAFMAHCQDAISSASIDPGRFIKVVSGIMRESGLTR